jgi:acetoin utilization deacetylase AcuC-like enzyme
MRRTGFLYDERFLLHCTGPEHPEAPERLLAAYKGIEEAGLLPHLVQLKATPARQKWIEAVHSARHIMRFEEACMLDLGEYEHPDNQICKDTYDIAFLAVGGILETAKLLMEGKIDNAFCAVRPPGHHAEPNKALGFCYFNNIAIAARYLQTEWNVERIGIIDFDVHHGNGTQHIFETDPSVFFYSIHEHPSFCFPGTGRDFESGYEEGAGYTLNSTVLPGQGDKEYMECIEGAMLPALDRFKPQVVLVSAGFDAHRDDDMSDMVVSTEGFSWIMCKILEIAEKYAEGRVISILEGGYCLARLPELIANHVKLLLHFQEDSATSGCGQDGNVEGKAAC